MLRSMSAALVLSILFLISATSARADSNSPELLNFNQLPNLTAVGSYYDGGAQGNVPNFGVSFTNFWGLRNGFGPFAPDPSQTPVIFVNTTATGPAGGTVTGIMTVGPGFSNGLNFLFTAAFGQGQSALITVWSGPNGTGTILATLRIYSNDASCGSTAMCIWTSVSAGFSGTAHSVTFTGPADEMGISDITLNSTRTALPEPSSIYLLAAGLLGISASQLRRFFKA
jgi:hypothetical protein